MSLATLDELGDQMGIVFDPASAAGIQAQKFLDKLSGYITRLTGLSFSVITNDVRTMTADYYGDLWLGNDPIIDVTVVTDPRDTTNTNVLGCGIYWDGVDTIFGFPPHMVVEVTYSHGQTTPTDIKELVLDVVEEALGAGSADAIQQLMIGDRTEIYGDVKALVKSMGEEVLDSYRTTETTYRLGYHRDRVRPYWLFWMDDC